MFMVIEVVNLELVYRLVPALVIHASAGRKGRNDNLAVFFVYLINCYMNVSGSLNYES